MSEAVRVVVRCRPTNRKEKEEGRQPIVNIRGASVQLTPPNREEKSFTYDAAFGPDSMQADVYAATARPIVESVLNGFNGTIFAYGQTGCGKSFSMEGLMEPPELRGIIPSSFVHVFEEIEVASTELQYLVRCSYIEIYNEEVRDLLGDPKQALSLKEDAKRETYVQGMKEVPVKSVGELLNALHVGGRNRQVGATAMNADSSRSHSVFTLVVEQARRDGEGGVMLGKLNLVDLAGSERQAKTGAEGERAKEGIKINLSLSALGNVISALSEGKSKHVPYRDSKLTRILQASLGGNTKTCMIAAISPADYNYDETISTLRYASRAKNIKNKPIVNEDPKDAMLKQFQEEIRRLKDELAPPTAAACGS